MLVLEDQRCWVVWNRRAVDEVNLFVRIGEDSIELNITSEQGGQSIAYQDDSQHD